MGSKNKKTSLAQFWELRDELSPVLECKGESREAKSQGTRNTLFHIKRVIKIQDLSYRNLKFFQLVLSLMRVSKI